MMSELDAQGYRLLAWLIGKLNNVVPGRPETYVSYKDAHEELNLQMLGPTYGESLKHQGLSSLANWTEETKKPGITGIIIDRSTRMPGEGYFQLFGKTTDSFEWWADQVRQSKQFDWSPYLSDSLRPAVEPSPSTRLGVFISYSEKKNGPFQDAVDVCNAHGYILWLEKASIKQWFSFPATILIKIKGEDRYYQGELRDSQER
jgi:hypothetical protein